MVNRGGIPTERVCYLFFHFVNFDGNIGWIVFGKTRYQNTTNRSNWHRTISISVYDLPLFSICQIMREKPKQAVDCSSEYIQFEAARFYVRCTFTIGYCLQVSFCLLFWLFWVLPLPPSPPPPQLLLTLLFCVDSRYLHMDFCL